MFEPNGKTSSKEPFDLTEDSEDIKFHKAIRFDISLWVGALKDLKVLSLRSAETWVNWVWLSLTQPRVRWIPRRWPMQNKSQMAWETGKGTAFKASDRSPLATHHTMRLSHPCHVRSRQLSCLPSPVTVPSAWQSRPIPKNKWGSCALTPTCCFMLHGVERDNLDQKNENGGQLGNGCLAFEIHCPRPRSWPQSPESQKERATKLVLYQDLRMLSQCDSCSL